MLAVFKVMTLQIPLLLGYIIPLGLYLSILSVLSRLCMDSEMTVMHACGISSLQLTGIIMFFTLLVTLFVGWLMIFAEPTLESYLQLTLDQATAQLSIHKIIPSKFTSIKNGQVIYAVNTQHDQQKIEHVFFAQRKPNTVSTSPSSWQITVANNASQQFIPKYKGNFIIFNQGHRYIATPGQRDIQINQFDHYGALLNPGILHEHLWPNSGTISQLWDKQYTDSQAAALLQWRIAMPISVLLFALLAIPLGQVSPRQGKFTRIIPAILIYMAYAYLVFSGRALIQAKTISPTLGLWWLHGGTLLLAIGLNLQQMSWPRLKALVGLSS